MKFDFAWALPVSALVLFSLLAFCPPSFLPNVQFASAIENASTATITVSAVIDASINCSTLNLGSHLPGASNATATQQCNMTVYSDTNTKTNVTLLGTDFTSGGNTLKVANVSYSNNSFGVGSCNTSLRTSARSGECGAAYNNTFNNWVWIPDPAVDYTTNMLFAITIPATQTKGAYTSTFTVGVVDALP